MRVLNKRTDRIPLSAVYIGRPSKWGNPFVIGQHGTRDEVIARYRAMLLANPVLMRDIVELIDRDVVCFCAPLACHGDVLVEVANRVALENLFK